LEAAIADDALITITRNCFWIFQQHVHAGMLLLLLLLLRAAATGSAAPHPASQATARLLLT
jgi:cytochrome b561